MSFDTDRNSVKKKSTDRNDVVPTYREDCKRERVYLNRKRFSVRRWRNQRKKNYSIHRALSLSWIASSEEFRFRRRLARLIYRRLSIRVLGKLNLGISSPGMAGILNKLRNLDAYPKINEDFYSRTLSGGVITLVSSVVMFLLFFSELRTWDLNAWYF